MVYYLPTNFVVIYFVVRYKWSFLESNWLCSGLVAFSNICIFVLKRPRNTLVISFTLVSDNWEVEYEFFFVACFREVVTLFRWLLDIKHLGVDNMSYCISVTVTKQNELTNDDVDQSRGHCSAIQSIRAYASLLIIANKAI